MNVSNLPTIDPSKLPSLTQLEAYLELADSVLPAFSSIPQVAFVHTVINPLLEGALKIGAQVQAGARGGDQKQMKDFIAAELQRLAALIHPQQ
jgi:hypothetical protein